MATSAKRASDLTPDQSINLGIANFFPYFFFFPDQKFTRDSQLIAGNKKIKKKIKKKEEEMRLRGLETPLEKYSNA